MNANSPSPPLNALTISVPHAVPLEDGEFVIEVRSLAGKLQQGLLRRVEDCAPRERSATP